MIASHVHDALRQVRRLQSLILERSLFEGYSGKARVLSGSVALVAAAVLASPCVPRTVNAHLTGWTVALLLALVFNYAALTWWFFFDPKVRRNVRLLKPAIDAVPALAVGAILSAALILAGEHRFLFGVWMSLYGLSQVAYRQSLPPGIYRVGAAYILCGTVCLLTPALTFLNPWPMGLVFFLGEIAGGLVLINHEHQAQSDENEN